LKAPLPANTHVVEYIPHDRLLPKVDVMVTNGGYGAVQRALSMGVPLVVAGRYLNAARRFETAFAGATAWPRSQRSSTRWSPNAARWRGNSAHVEPLRRHARRAFV
jgi:UDP-glucoronosyl and UDP-glucosyl transferase